MTMGAYARTRSPRLRREGELGFAVSLDRRDSDGTLSEAKASSVNRQASTAPRALERRVRRASERRPRGSTMGGTPWRRPIQQSVVKVRIIRSEATQEGPETAPPDTRAALRHRVAPETPSTPETRARQNLVTWPGLLLTASGFLTPPRSRFREPTCALHLSAGQPPASPALRQCTSIPAK